MKIADIDFGPRPVFLAPMEDVTDIGFRLLCKRFGASMVYTEFVSAEALVRSVKATINKMAIRDEERPVGIQIYGRSVEDMVEAARIVEQCGPDLIDLNFGCPVKKVAGKGAGAGMLQNIPLMLNITREVVKAVKLPVTVKTRLGWNNEQLIITDLAEQLQDCGISALTIHGRTRAQMYTGQADWTLIGEVKRNPRIHIPIIGNGDITSAEEAKAAFERYGVDAVMVGRAIPGHSLTLAAIGVFILWFGWFGFNPGSQLAAATETDRTAISHVFLTTNLAAIAGGIATMCVTWFKYGKPSFSLTLNGILAGLVGITAGCDLVSPLGALIIGLICGTVLVFGIESIDTKLHIDDPVGASTVHGVCGILGTLLTGVLAVDGGLVYGGGWNFLGAQLFGIICIDLWAAAAGLIMFYAIKKLAGLRVDKRVEEEGLDIYEHGESAYN